MIINCDIFGDDDETRTIVMRNTRNQLLAGSDFTHVTDSPLTAEQKQAWATYRQALRDFPATWTPSDTADFPDPPA